MYMQDLVILIGAHRLLKLEVQVIQISFVKSLLKMRNVVKRIFCNLLGDNGFMETKRQVENCNQNSVAR